MKARAGPGKVLGSKGSSGAGGDHRRVPLEGVGFVRNFGRFTEGSGDLGARNTTEVMQREFLHIKVI